MKQQFKADQGVAPLKAVMSTPALWFEVMEQAPALAIDIYSKHTDLDQRLHLGFRFLFQCTLKRLDTWHLNLFAGDALGGIHH